MVKLSLIVAVSENNVIGKDNDLPWKLPSELQYFKATTLGKPVIMGRKTYDSIGRPLPGRPNIVITRDKSFAPEGVITAFGLEMALEVGKSLAEARGVDEVMVIGGAEIFRLCLPDADRLYLTRVHGAVEGDTCFPEIDPDDWLLAAKTKVPAGEKDSHAYSLMVLDRV